MKLARVAHDGRVHLARIEGDSAVLLSEESHHPAADALREALASELDLHRDGEVVDLGAVRLLAPVRNPSKLLCIGLNYADHAREAGLTPPAAPLVFAKTPNTIIGPGDPIVVRAGDTEQADYEAELAVVIGRRASRIEGDPLDHVFGYTVCNDVSARDAQFADGQWLRGKSFDTFCPLGPWIVTADDVADPEALGIRCDVSGERLQDSTTAELIFGIGELVTYLSRFLTLEPGDVIATGTPFGVGFARTPPRYLHPGDEVTVSVEGIGELTNPVVGG
jgi:2-keto-4-pentenoate hydratase/2-oxohepta-3-ene-1,7-dioic acid hydratase in catechol pathway